MGDNSNFISGTNDNLDDDSYNTPPKIIKYSEPEYDDNPNVPENPDNNLENDSEVEELLNNPENDTTIDLHKLLNFPDILDLKKTGNNISNTDIDQSEESENQPSHSCQKVSRSHSPTGYSRSG